MAKPMSKKFYAKNGSQQLLNLKQKAENERLIFRANNAEAGWVKSQ